MNNSYSEKFKNLVLYILSHDSYREGGIKKLNKILYFIDFYFFKEHERFISDVNYAKANMGPVVDGYQKLFSEMVTDGVLKQQTDGVIVYRPTQACDLSFFEPEEIEHIRNILDEYGKLSASILETISHQQQPWLLTEKMGDIIDPDLALLIDNSESEEVNFENEKLKSELISLADSV
ncbi:MAG TPA: Panacea domain-containing protein [Patescibacteria group bacterium]|nr:Panacea domain-containing protein [Patescibacteria group bacterium]